MTPLTVLHVNTEHGFRGGEIQNLYLADGLSRRGHRCILALQEESTLGERAEERCRCRESSTPWRWPGSPD